MTVTAVTATTVVRRNGPGDVGRDDREHSGRAHRLIVGHTHTHTHMYTPLFARSFARLLARSRGQARACRHDVRRRRGKKKHRGSAIRADTRHCALARYRLAPVLHGRTRGSLLERLVAKLRGRAPSLSRGSCPSVSRCQARARTTHPFVVHPYRSLLLSFANPRQPPTTPGTHSLHPLLCLILHPHLFPACLFASTFFLPRYAFTLLSYPSKSHGPLLSRTSNCSLFLFPYHPRPRGKRFAGRILSPRGSRATCVLVLAPRGNESLHSRVPTTLMEYVLQRTSSRFYDRHRDMQRSMYLDFYVSCPRGLMTTM